MRSISATKLADAIAAAVKAAPPLPESPDEIPDGTDLDTLDRWLMIAERNGRAAEQEGNLQALAQMGRLSASLLDAKRKSAPLPVPDPNEHPDMIKLGAEVEERLHRMVDILTKGEQR